LGQVSVHVLQKNTIKNGDVNAPDAIALSVFFSGSRLAAYFSLLLFSGFLGDENCMRPTG